MSIKPLARSLAKSLAKPLTKARAKSSGKPLAGCGVLVTRPAEQAHVQALEIEALGGKALLFPVLVIEPTTPERLTTSALTSAALKNDELKTDSVAATHDILATADWFVFISPNAVEHGWRFVKDHIAHARIAAVGPGTAKALTACGCPADIFPLQGNSENLLASPTLANMQNQQVIILRGDTGRELLASTLKQRGARVTYLPVYRRILSSASIAPLNAAWREERLHAVSLMSTSTLEGLHQLLDNEGRDHLARSQLVGTSPRMLKLSRELSLPLPLLANGVDNQAVIKTLCAWWQTNKSD